MLRYWNYDTDCCRSRNLTAAWLRWGVSQVPIEVERQGGRGRRLSRNRNDILCRETSHSKSVWSLLTSSRCMFLPMFPVRIQNIKTCLERENRVSTMPGLESYAWGLFFCSWVISVNAGITYSLQQAIISIRNCFILSYVIRQCTERDSFYRMSLIWSFCRHGCLLCEYVLLWYYYVKWLKY